MRPVLSLQETEGEEVSTLTPQRPVREGADARQCTVIVRPESATCFIACPLGLPQLESSAPTAAEAVEQVKQKLSLWLKDAEVVEVSIPTGNPWLDTFGRSANDPQFDEYLTELQRYRKEQEVE